MVKIAVDRTKQVGLKCTINKPTFCPDNGETLTVEEIRSILENISDDYSIEKTRWYMEDVPQ